MVRQMSSAQIVKRLRGLIQARRSAELKEALGYGWLSSTARRLKEALRLWAAEFNRKAKVRSDARRVSWTPKTRRLVKMEPCP